MNHSKINYVKYTKDIFPNYEYYSWIDFGCIKNDEYILSLPKNINFNNLCDDDQNVVLQIYYDNPDLFDLKYSNNIWFSLFKKTSE